MDSDPALQGLFTALQVSVCNAGSEYVRGTVQSLAIIIVLTCRNLMENYYYPNKSSSKGAALKVTLPPEQSVMSSAAKRNSLNSLPTSVAEDSQR